MIFLDGSVFYYIFCWYWNEGQIEDFKDLCYGWYLEDIYVVYKDFDDLWVEFVCLLFCLFDQNEVFVFVSVDECCVYIYQDFEGNGDFYYFDFF